MSRLPRPDPLRRAAPPAKRQGQACPAGYSSRARPAPPVLAGGLAAALMAALAAFPAAAETLHCRSVNGNVTCSGSGAVSCQTVNGRTTCIGGNGAVMQQFGPATRPAPPPAADMPEEEDEDAAPAARPLPGRHPLRLERRGPAGQWMLLERDGPRLRLRSERLSLDLD